MSDLEPQWRTIRQWPPNDFMALFASRSRWVDVKQKVQVFNLSVRFLLTSSDTDFIRVISFLKAAHIALSIQAQPLTETKLCGTATEGFGPPDDMARVTQRLHSVGADLRYAIMDEPLYFGHQFIGSPGQIPCNYSMERLADEAAQKLKPLLDTYPNVQIEDVEPIGTGTPGTEWAQDIILWHDLFARKSGKTVNLFDADIIWNMPGSLDNAMEMFDVLRKRPLSIGVIYHGFAGAASDTEWSQTALDEARSLEVARKFKPDRILIESWNDRPRALLPESTPGTFTNLIMRYAEGKWRH